MRISSKPLNFLYIVANSYNVTHLLPMSPVEFKAYMVKTLCITPWNLHLLGMPLTNSLEHQGFRRPMAWWIMFWTRSPTPVPTIGDSEGDKSGTFAIPTRRIPAVSLSELAPMASWLTEPSCRQIDGQSRVHGSILFLQQLMGIQNSWWFFLLLVPLCGQKSGRSAGFSLGSG